MPSAQPALDGALGLTLHDVAKSLSKPFGDVKRLYNANLDYLDTAKEIHITIESGNFLRPTQEVASAVLSLDDAKYLVARSNTHEGKLYIKWLIQQEKKAETLDQMLSNPENAVKVFQRLADTQKELNEALKTKQAADKRAYSAMGTAGNLSKKLTAATAKIETLSTALEAEKAAHRPKYRVCGITVMDDDLDEWGIDTCSKVTTAIVQYMAALERPKDATARSGIVKQLWYAFRSNLKTYASNSSLNVDEWRIVVANAIRAYGKTRCVFEEIS